MEKATSEREAVEASLLEAEVALVEVDSLDDGSDVAPSAVASANVPPDAVPHIDALANKCGENDPSIVALRASLQRAIAGEATSSVHKRPAEGDSPIALGEVPEDEFDTLISQYNYHTNEVTNAFGRESGAEEVQGDTVEKVIAAKQKLKQKMVEMAFVTVEGRRTKQR